MHQIVIAIVGLTASLAWAERNSGRNSSTGSLSPAVIGHRALATPWNAHGFTSLSKSAAVARHQQASAVASQGLEQLSKSSQPEKNLSIHSQHVRGESQKTGAVALLDKVTFSSFAASERPSNFFVESGWRPGTWCAAPALLILGTVALRFGIGGLDQSATEGKTSDAANSRFKIITLMILSTFSGCSQNVLTRSLYAAIGDVTLLVLFMILVTQQISGAMFAAAFGSSTTFTTSSTQDVFSVNGILSKVLLALILGITDLVGSLLKGVAFLACPISTGIAIRGCSVPLSLGMRMFGLGKPTGRAATAEIVCLVFGTCLCCLGLIFSKDEKPDGRFRAAEIEQLLSLSISERSCMYLMVACTVINTVNGNIGEFVIHNKIAADVDVQWAQSVGSFFFTMVGFVAVLSFSSGKAFQMPAISSPIGSILFLVFLNAMIKGSDKIIGITFTATKDYAWKRAVGMVKVGPALLFEAICYYIFADRIMGRPWHLDSWLIFTGACVCVFGILFFVKPQHV